MTALATLPRSAAAAAAAASAGEAGTNGGSPLPAAGDAAAELRAAANGDGSLPGGGAAGFEGGSGGEEGAAECTSEWRMQLGAYALRAQRDGSTLVRAQLCRLLRALAMRYAPALRRGAAQLHDLDTSPARARNDLDLQRFGAGRHSAGSPVAARPASVRSDRLSSPLSNSPPPAAAGSARASASSGLIAPSAAGKAVSPPPSTSLR
mmetsp:Transcript_44170/g.142415  ORF Transcript_44170/g.142415 Transcript_44170/m.142415 type:complete len:207 (+) Transcript_44170:3-623(+)